MVSGLRLPPPLKRPAECHRARKLQFLRMSRRIEPAEEETDQKSVSRHNPGHGTQGPFRVKPRRVDRDRVFQERPQSEHLKVARKPSFASVQQASRTFVDGEEL